MSFGLNKVMVQMVANQKVQGQDDHVEIELIKRSQFPALIRKAHYNLRVNEITKAMPLVLMEAWASPKLNIQMKGIIKDHLVNLLQFKRVEQVALTTALISSFIRWLTLHGVRFSPF